MPFVFRRPWIQPPRLRHWIGGAGGLVVEQEGFRWRHDDGNEAAANWLDSQDVNITREQDQNTRLRLIINVVGNATTSALQLEQRKQGSNDWYKIPLP